MTHLDAAWTIRLPTHPIPDELPTRLRRLLHRTVHLLADSGMPLVDGIAKPAGVRCAQLSEDNRCLIFGRPERPAVCASLRPTPEMCGTTREHAMRWLVTLEQTTRPAVP
jgi:hypothetical protein